jgi:hypothetical protein
MASAIQSPTLVPIAVAWSIRCSHADHGKVTVAVTGWPGGVVQVGTATGTRSAAAFGNIPGAAVRSSEGD